MVKECSRQVVSTPYGPLDLKSVLTERNKNFYFARVGFGSAKKYFFSRELVSDLMIWPISVHENLIFILGELVSDKPTQRFRREGQKRCS